MNKARLSVGVAVVAAALALGAAAMWLQGAGRSTPVAPNILLITLDTTRADHLGAYGYQLGRTTHLDRLASEGVVFERALAAAPLTLPSHVSLFTGLYPFAHGVRSNGDGSFDDASPTLATALRGQGYRTAAFVSAFVLDRRFGLARGFDHYDDALEASGAVGDATIERRGDRTARAALEWLTAHAGHRDRPSPFFMWLHLFDPHDPYEPPAPFRESFADRLYDGEIAFTDTAIGTVLDRLDALGLRDSTLVAVVGDHGESLGEHGEATHALFLYEAALRVPMMLRWPGHLPPATRVSALVRGIDLAPTILDLAGASALPGSAGQSLLPLIHNRPGGPEGAYAETYFPLLYMNWAPLRSIQDDRWKFVDAPTAELYDLSTDPGELTNLAAREPSRAAALRRALEMLTRGAQRPVAAAPLDRDTAARLAALGYIGAAALTPYQDSGRLRPDPKSMIGIFNLLRVANSSLQEGRPGAAVASAKRVLASDPQNAFAFQLLARGLMQEGRNREAIAAFQSYVALVPTSADGHHWMAICYARQGEPDRALAEEEAALAIDPRHAEARLLRGGLFSARGEFDQAVRELREAVTIEPRRAAFRLGLARALTEARRFDEADAEYRHALEIDPTNADAYSAYGAMFAERGELERSIGLFEHALTLRPQQHSTRLYLAEMLMRRNRHSDARVEYERLVSDRDTPADIRAIAKRRLQ